MMKKTFDNKLINDRYKKARNLHPDVNWIKMWKQVSDRTKQEIWDGLGEEIDANLDDEELDDI